METSGYNRPVSRRRAGFVFATDASLAILGVASLSGSLFAFGAWYGYGLSPLWGIAAAGLGLVLLGIANLLKWQVNLWLLEHRRQVYLPTDPV